MKIKVSQQRLVGGEFTVGSRAVALSDLFVRNQSGSGSDTVLIRLDAVDKKQKHRISLSLRISDVTRHDQDQDYIVDNPFTTIAQPKETALQGTFNDVQTLISALDVLAELNPVLGALRVSIQIFRNILRRPREKQLAEEFEERLQTIKSLISMMENVTSQPFLYNYIHRIDPDDLITHQLQESVEFFKQYYSNAGILTRNQEREFKAVVEAFQSVSTALQTVQLMDIHRSTNLLGEHMQIIIAEKMAELPQFPYLDASWDSSVACTPGTRSDVLENIHNWLRRSNEGGTEQIYLLTGAPGSGKTVIANTVAKDFNDAALLASSFFFTHSDAVRSTPKNVCLTIARDLARRDSQLAGLIVDRSKADSFTIPSWTLLQQWKELVVSPLSSLPAKPGYVILFDAIDEIPLEDRAELVAIITSAPFPPNLRLFLSCRFDPDIQTAFDKLDSALYTRFDLDLSSDASQNDVSVFVDASFSRLAQHFGAPQGWPTLEQKLQVVQRSAGLFLWAAALFHFLEASDNPVEALSRMLQETTGILPQDTSNQPYLLSLDYLYLRLLHDIGDDMGETFWENVRAAIGMTATVFNPLSVSAMAILLGEDETRVGTMFTGLRSVLLNAGEFDKPVRVIHPSFLGFITDETRCRDPRFVILATYHHEQMAVRCLRVLREFRDNAVIDNVDGKYNSFDGPLEGVTREEVKYAIQYCWSHICQVVSPSQPFLREVQDFLRQNCVRWLALRCAVNMVDGLITALESLGDWVSQHRMTQTSEGDQIESIDTPSHMSLLCVEMVSLIKGLADFSTTYLELINTFPSHIYSSAVAFIPPATSIEFLRTSRHNIPRVIVGLRRTWQPFITLRSHESDINFATFSRSGALLVTVSAQTVNIWKVQTLHRPHSSLRASSFTHGASFAVARFTADDDSLIIGFSNGYVATWNVTEEKLDKETALFSASRVIVLRCILEGQLAAAVSWEGRLSLWNYDTGKIWLKDSAQFGKIVHVAMNGRKQVAVAGLHSGVYRVQRIEYDGDPVQLKPVSQHVSTKDTLLGMKYTIDGEHIVLVSISGITLINSKDGSVARQFSFAEVKDFQSACLSIKGQGDRDYLMVALVGGSMELWEISADSPSSDSEWAVLRKTIQRGNPQKILAMSANGTSVVLGKYSADAIFWNVRGATASDEPDLGPTGEHLWAPTFSPHGSLFAAACTGNFIRIWSCTAKTDQPATTIQCEEVGTSLNLALSHDDKLLACAREKAVSVFDLESREEIALFIPPSMHSIKSCFHPRDPKIALISSTDDDHITVIIWGYKAGNINFEWRSQEPFSGEPQNIIFSRTGRFLAASWQRDTVIIIDLEHEDTEKSSKIVQFPRSVYRLAFSEDEMCLWGETDEEQDASTSGIGSCQWWFQAGATPFFTRLHHHDCPFNFKLNKDGWVVTAPPSRASKNERLFRIPTLDLEEHVFSPGNSARLAYIDLEGQLVLVDFSTLFSGQQ